MTDAKPDWIKQFSAKMKKDGWATVIGSSDLELDDQQTEAGMAVDMEIARKAEVFIGNGVSHSVILFTRAFADEWCDISGRRSRAISCTCGWSTSGLH
jgi:hypothetical protein